MIINVLNRYGELGIFLCLDDDPSTKSDLPRRFKAGVFCQFLVLDESKMISMMMERQPMDIFMGWEYGTLYN
jgi:hypothetical protein